MVVTAIENSVFGENYRLFVAEWARQFRFSERRNSNRYFYIFYDPYTRGGAGMWHVSRTAAGRKAVSLYLGKRWSHEVTTRVRGDGD